MQLPPPPPIIAVCFDVRMLRAIVNMVRKKENGEKKAQKTNNRGIIHGNITWHLNPSDNNGKSTSTLQQEWKQWTLEVLLLRNFQTMNSPKNIPQCTVNSKSPRY
jgi:hypothetical protein